MWVTGEIYIGGVGVARGYWKEEEKTRRSFREEGGERYYRTGDKGRYMGGWEHRVYGEEGHAGEGAGIQDRVRGDRGSDKEEGGGEEWQW